MKALILVFFASFGLEGLYSAEQEVVLDVDEGVTWEKIFSSGFRPQHLSGGEYMCTQYEVPLALVSSKNNQKLNLGIGDVDFKVKEGSLLIGISFYGRESRSLEEAKSKSQSFAGIFGENVTQRAELITFETRHEVDYAGQKIEPPQIETHVDLKTTTNAAKVKDFSIIYSFSDSYLDDLPLVERLSITLKSKEAKRAKRLAEKINPPAGYEHISLEPTEGNDNSEEQSVILESRMEIRPSSFNKLAQNQVSSPGKHQALSWLYWVLGVLILGGVGVLVWNSRKGSSAG